MEIYCSICEQVCDIQEACERYNPEQTCEVAVCLNKECSNYDKVVFEVDEYLSDKAEDDATERAVAEWKGEI